MQFLTVSVEDGGQLSIADLHPETGEKLMQEGCRKPADKFKIGGKGLGLAVKRQSQEIVGNTWREAFPAGAAFFPSAVIGGVVAFNRKSLDNFCGGAHGFKLSCATNAGGNFGKGNMLVNFDRPPFCFLPVLLFFLQEFCRGD